MFIFIATVVNVLSQVPIHPVLYVAIEADDSGTLRAPRGRDWQSLADAFRQEAGAIGSLAGFRHGRLISGHSGELRYLRRA